MLNVFICNDLKQMGMVTIDLWLVLAWCAIHFDGLLQNRENAVNHEELYRIDPKTRLPGAKINFEGWKMAYSKDQIIKKIEDLGIQKNETILIHSSMKIMQ